MTGATLEHSTMARQLPLRSLEMTRRRKRTTLLARLIILGLFIMPFALMLMPWTQFIHGTGRAIAFNPVLRPQYIVAPIEGRIRQWFVVEGDRVKAGQRIVELVDNDPNLIMRLEEEVIAVQQRLAAAEGRIGEITLRLQAVELSTIAQIATARANTLAAINRVAESQAMLTEAQERLKVAQFEHDVQKQLFESKVGTLASEIDLRRAEFQFKSAEAMIDARKESLAAMQQILVATKEVEKRTEEDTKAAVASERAILETARGDLAAIRQNLVQAQARLSRQRAQEINAPVDGTIFRLLANAEQGGVLVRPGERLAVLVPDVKEIKSPVDAIVPMTGVFSLLAGWATPSHAIAEQLFLSIQNHWPEPASIYPGIVVEINIDGNDQPLVRVGDRVRIQFEGWPAVQLVGWPSVAVGTFAGRVYLIDPTTNDKGQFRILVESDKHMPGDIPWPDHAYLRQGVRANGWVLMEKPVTLGWELFRRLSGFPIARDMEPKKEPSLLGPVQRK
ncbi:MAG TPA: biotin/lipoyl-binding protein [Gemmatales bacterium]|nr:biotin/lipoyl-binding protein [Gemmatales bacterium]HMP58456.1 biotin/lipoyl-binding protein [Gemmatales bacterium]